MTKYIVNYVKMKKTVGKQKERTRELIFYYVLGAMDSAEIFTHVNKLTAYSSLLNELSGKRSDLSTVI